MSELRPRAGVVLVAGRGPVSGLRVRRLRLATQDCYSPNAAMGMGLMAPRTNIRSGVASPVTTSHVAKGSVFVNLRNTDNLEIGPRDGVVLVAGRGPVSGLRVRCEVSGSRV